MKDQQETIRKYANAFSELKKSTQKSAILNHVEFIKKNKLSNTFFTIIYRMKIAERKEGKFVWLAKANQSDEGLAVEFLETQRNYINNSADTAKKHTAKKHTAKKHTAKKHTAKKHTAKKHTAQENNLPLDAENPFSVVNDVPRSMRSTINPILVSKLVASLKTLPVSDWDASLIPKQVAETHKIAQGIFLYAKKSLRESHAEREFSLKKINDGSGEYLQSRVYRIA